MAKQRVLFLCTGNSIRSQMGEAFLRHFAGDRFEVYSAGYEAKGVNPYTIQVMDEMGIDIRGQRSKPTKEYMGQMLFNYLITVCSDVETDCPRALWAQGGKRLRWPFDNPAVVEGTDAEKLAKFREVRDQIAAKVQHWLAEVETH